MPFIDAIRLNASNDDSAFENVIASNGVYSMKNKNPVSIITKGRSWYTIKTILQSSINIKTAPFNVTPKP